MSWGLRTRLSLLWFLHFAIWGSWMTYAPVHFKDLGIPPDQRGLLFASMCAALWFAPFLAGQIADRWVATERYLTVSHLVGGLLLLELASLRDFWPLMIAGTLYAMVYIPTWPLASSLTFQHLPDRDQQFGGVRLWGTVGWVAAGWTFGVWLSLDEPELVAWKAWLVEALGLEPSPSNSDCFRLAALFSFALAALCLWLPHTPPHRRRRRPIAPLAVLGLFGYRSFTALIAVAFVLATIVPFYLLILPTYLESLGYSKGWIPRVQTIGQVTEVPALLLLPWLLRWIGSRAVIAFGLAAWVFRYSAFAFGGPHWLVVLAIGLHGICHVFILIVGQLYVDSLSQKDVRASAQNFLAFVSLGVGLPLGFLFAGSVNAYYQSDYFLIFQVPAIVVMVLLVFFWIGFGARQPDADPLAAGSEPCATP